MDFLFAHIEIPHLIHGICDEVLFGDTFFGHRYFIFQMKDCSMIPWPLSLCLLVLFGDHFNWPK